ncbi:MAG TPA: CaiB/BaiF CoA-transferase family protein [Acidimicrobiia bacterium]|nr:CaiB/BaiF CoA-transferase family protein [Acidimicrobiia bacterium]
MGPLAGVKIVELAGIGPGPFSGMVLSDMGADIVRVDRAAQVNPATFDRPNLEPLYRGRRSVGVDLKNPEGVELVLRLVEQADALVEGYRPGVTERLGLGPDVCLARNPKLVYGRMTGWGQDGPLAQAAGHDINYIALAGALAHFGRAGEKPVPPINLVGDFGGGGMFMAFGVVCGILEAQRSGTGQVIDVAMVDGAAILMSMMWGFRQLGVWNEERHGTNVLDTGAPFYDVYETKDGKYVSLGSLEPQFYAELLQRLGLTDSGLAAQMDPGGYPQWREKFTQLFKTKMRDEWDQLLLGGDACYAPVLTMTEATNNEHIKARNTIIEPGGVPQPAPAPRFSRTEAEVQRPAPWPGQHTDEALRDWGIDPADITKLRETGAIA